MFPRPPVVIIRPPRIRHLHPWRHFHRHGGCCGCLLPMMGLFLLIGIAASALVFRAFGA